MGVIRRLDANGDTVMAEWQVDKPSQKVADEEFKRLVSEGHLAYTQDPVTRENEQLKTFKPEAEEIIVHRQFVGG